MGDGSRIEWTEATWNPVSGCDRVSPGCDQCYALTMAARLKGMGSEHYQTDGPALTSGPGFGISFHGEKTLTQPLRWTKPRRVFVDSMGDLFHKDVPDEFIARVFAVMAAAPQHTFQLLTKRHGRMRSLLNNSLWWQYEFASACRDLGVDYAAAGTWSGDVATLPNVHLGVSVEDQKHADLRIPALLGTPAAVRWISAEPLLGPIDLTRLPFPAWTGMSTGQPDAVVDAVGGRYGVPGRWQAKATGLDWIVCGGESGAKARPMHPDWPRSLRDQCETAGVPFLFKQWGSWAAGSNGYGLGKRECLVTRTGEWVSPPVALWEVPDWARDDINRMGWSFMHRPASKHDAGRTLDGRLHDGYPVGSEMKR